MGRWYQVERERFFPKDVIACLHGCGHVIAITKDKVTLGRAPVGVNTGLDDNREISKNNNVKDSDNRSNTCPTSSDQNLTQRKVPGLCANGDRSVSIASVKHEDNQLSCRRDKGCCDGGGDGI
eukprot:TRINITY_DN10977_c0_g1_i1.p1 TRINITY_DN10977_c0_g1~~TRINITY_DN10977_c0_g1_i1.p1  ORF type:complete len:123 (-),score=30.19 TRINITY_DN10977_c0_g1_i1:188-556(-)